MHVCIYIFIFETFILSMAFSNYVIVFHFILFIYKQLKVTININWDSGHASLNKQINAETNS